MKGCLVVLCPAPDQNSLSSLFNNPTLNCFPVKGSVFSVCMGVEDVGCGAAAGASVGVIAGKDNADDWVGAGVGLEVSEGHLCVRSGCWSLGTRAQERDYLDQGNPQQLCVCVYIYHHLRTSVFS